MGQLVPLHIGGTFFGAAFLILAKKMRDKVELSHYMVGLCTLNQVDPYPITYNLSNP
jgi:hypothetical protein